MPPSPWPMISRSTRESCLGVRGVRGSTVGGAHTAHACSARFQARFRVRPIKPVTAAAKTTYSACRATLSRMTVRELLAELQQLPRDLEGLAYEAGARTTASARSTSSSSRAAGTTCTWEPDGTSHTGGSRLGPWPRSILIRRRPCGGCEPPSASSRSCGWSTMTWARTRTTASPWRRRGAATCRPVGQSAGGALRRYTTRWRWFG